MPTGCCSNKTLVMAEIQIGFGPVMRDEHFAVLKRAHGARVDIDVRIELDHRDFEAAGFEYGA